MIKRCSLLPLLLAALILIHLLSPAVGNTPGAVIPCPGPGASQPRLPGGNLNESGSPAEKPAPDTAPPPSQEKEAIKEIQGLVRLSDLQAGFIFDLKYATENNFMGKAVYPAAVAVLKKETALRLAEANRIFQADGYTIKIWDAYRPLSVQRILWETCPDTRYVTNPDPLPPAGGWKARHYNGMSVDITLVDANGHELEMPTDFDDFSEKAAPDYPGMSDGARNNYNYLKAVMESLGFKNPATEWWHFNDLLGTPTPYLDVPLEAFLD